MHYIHLAGTNGKGSTAQYLAEILGISHRCGLFTSPHILSPLERFRINGKEITQAEYDAYLAAEQEEKRTDVPAIWTLFGVWTDMALKWFCDRGVEYAVIEAGLGGRKDQTNVVESEIQIITPVSFDHTEYLGESLKQIAYEKCGIIKWRSTVIAHPQADEALDVIRRTCDRMDCRLIVLDKKAVSIHQAGEAGQVFSFRYEELYLDHASISAMAGVQVENACVAAIAAYELGIAPEEIGAGIGSTQVRGRVEYHNGIVVDAAHNAAAIHELAGTVERYFSKKHIVALTAVMEDKDIRAIADGVASFADAVVCTCADKKRGLPAKEYARFFDRAQAMESPSHAFAYARELQSRKKGILVVCGSFYLLQYVYENREF